MTELARTSSNCKRQTHPLQLKHHVLKELPEYIRHEISAIHVQQLQHVLRIKAFLEAQ
jgi:hypothetical protein